MFTFHTTPVKTQQTPAMLDLRKTRSEKSRDYRDYLVLKHHFKNVFRAREKEKPAFSYSSGLKSVFEDIRFRRIDS